MGWTWVPADVTSLAMLGAWTQADTPPVVAPSGDGQVYVDTSTVATSGAATMYVAHDGQWVQVGGTAGPVSTQVTIAAGLPLPTVAAALETVAVTAEVTIAAGLPLPTVAAEIETVAAAPVLSVGTVTSTSVGLNWTSVPGADHYQAQRDSNAILGPIEQTNFTYLNLTPNTTSTYRVRAVVGGVAQDWSNTVEVTTLAAGSEVTVAAGLPLPTVAAAVTVGGGSEIVWWSDFSEMTTDAAPAGMTVQLAGGTTTNWLVRAKADTTGGKTLEFTGSGNANRMLAVDAAGQVDPAVPVEIVGRFRHSHTTGTRLGLAARAQSAAATFFAMRPGNGATQTFRYVDGTATVLHAGTLGSVAAGNWHCFRLRVEGASVKSKFWDGTAGDEPGTPTTEWANESTSDPNITAAGYVGLFANNTFGTQDVDFLGVAVGGPSAPKINPNP